MSGDINILIINLNIIFKLFPHLMICAFRIIAMFTLSDLF